jgi:programmed cell death protein 5
MVKAERARQVEDYLIKAATSRQLSGKVDEEQLINILEQVAQQKNETKITIQRRDIFDDEDW